MVMIIIRSIFLSLLLLFYGNAFADYQTILKKAKQGNAESQYTLGTLYELGEGVAEDDKEAFKWFSLAASQGYAKAQNNLGYMYDLGEGVAQDNIRAYMWKNLAAAQGDIDAAEQRDDLASSMTKEQLKKAQKMARDCKARNYKSCD